MMKKFLNKIINKLPYILIGMVLTIAGTVSAINITVPQATQVGQIPCGLSTGNYAACNLIAGTNITISTGTPGQITITAANGASGAVANGIAGYVTRYTSSSTISTGVLLDNATVAGVNATSSTVNFNVQGTGQLNPFNVASSTGTSLFSVSLAGAVAVPNTLTVTGQTTLGNASSSSITNSGTFYEGGTFQMTSASSLIQTSGQDITIQQTGDTFGTTSLKLVNRNGQNGALFSQQATGAAEGVVDFLFQPDQVANPNVLRNLRVENRGGVNVYTGQNPEMQFGNFFGSPNPTFVIGNTATLVRFGTFSIASGTPIGALTVVGTTTVPNVFVVASSTNTPLLTVANNGSTTISSLGAGCVNSTATGSLYVATCAAGGGGTNYWTTLTNGIYNNSGYLVGINSTTPIANLVVQGSSTAPTLPILIVSTSTNKSLLTVFPNGSVEIGTGSSSPNVPLIITSNATLTPTFTILSPDGNPSVEIRDPGFQNVTGTGNATRSLYMGYLTGALASTTALGNTAFGFKNLYTNNGQFNTAIGDFVLTVNTTGTQNTGVGEAPLDNNTTGSLNTAVGNDAMFSNTIGSSNSAYGAFAMKNHIQGNYNVAIGEEAMFSDQVSTSSVVIGFQAGYSQTTSTNNTLVGYQAGVNITTGSSNTAIGQLALSIATSTSFNTVLGSFAGQNATGSQNTLIGYNAMQAVTGGGSNNTALGLQAGLNAGAGNGGIYLGSNAGFNETGGGKLYIANNKVWPLISGDLVNGYVNINATNTAANLYVQGTTTSATANILNIASSSGTSYLIVKPSGNVGIGTTAPQSLFTVNGDIRMLAPDPSNYLLVNETNSLVTFEFFQSGVRDNLLTLSGAGGLTWNGAASFTGVTTVGGFVDTAVLSSAPAGTSLSNSNAGILEIWGNTGNPTFVNWNEKSVANRGSLGFAASSADLVYRSGATTLSDGTERFRVTGSSFLIGTTTNMATLSVQGVAGTNPMAIASSTGAQLMTVTQSGNVGIGTTTPGFKFVVTGTVQFPNVTTASALQTGDACFDAAGQITNDSVLCVASSKRFKQNIQPLTVGLDEILKFNPVSFYWKPAYMGPNIKNPNKSGQHYSLIAEDVQKIDPNLASVDTVPITFEGKTSKVGDAHGLQDLNNFVALFVQGFKDLNAKLTAMMFRQNTADAKIQTLEVKVDKQQAEIDHMKLQINQLLKGK